jgi:hypothetical protein
VPALTALDLPRGNCSNIPPHPLRGRRHLDVAHPEFAERVDNGVDHGTQLQVSALLASIAPMAAFASTPPCGQPDPVTGVIVQCGNGPVVPLATTWGAGATWVSSGATITDFRGKTDLCAPWMGIMGCADIGGARTVSLDPASFVVKEAEMRWVIAGARVNKRASKVLFRFEWRVADLAPVLVCAAHSFRYTRPEFCIKLWISRS